MSLPSYPTADPRSLLASATLLPSFTSDLQTGAWKTTIESMRYPLTISTMLLVLPSFEGCLFFWWLSTPLLILLAHATFLLLVA